MGKEKTVKPRTTDAKSPPGRDDSFFARRKREMVSFERNYLTNLLTETGGDISRAAREAGLPRGTLYRFLKIHNIDPAKFRR